MPLEYHPRLQAAGLLEALTGTWTTSPPLMRTIGQTEMKVLWKRKTSGDEIKFTRSTEGGALTEIAGNRAK